MFKKLSLAMLFAVAGVMLMPATATAQEEMAEEGPSTYFSLGADYTTIYFFRGIWQGNDDSGSFQPWAEGGVTIYEGEKFVTSVDVFAGIWNSFQGSPTGNSTNNQWYELDVYAGFAVGLPANFAAGATVTAYTSPNDAFDTVSEVALDLAYDDSDLWGEKFAGLQPYLVIAFEFDGEADGGGDEGIYLELGIEPSFAFMPDSDYPITIAIPVTLGLSVDDYYQDATGDDETFGFLDIGVVASMPLTMVPSKFGAWSVSAGVHALFLGDHTEQINENDDFEIIGTLGLAVDF